jgi:hypothetical protein
MKATMNVWRLGYYKSRGIFEFFASARSEDPSPDIREILPPPMKKLPVLEFPSIFFRDIVISD